MLRLSPHTMPRSVNQLLNDANALLKLRGKGLLRAFLLLLTALLITALLPDQKHFNYQYELNRPWLHRDLIAPFDFTIQKTAAQLEIEREQRLEQHRPYYSLDLQWGASVLQEFKKDFRSRLPEETYRELRANIDSIFDAGILGDGPMHPTGEFFCLRAQDDKLLLRVSDVLNQERAFNSFKAALQNQPVSIDLTDSLYLFVTRRFTPNLSYNASRTAQEEERLLEGLTESLGTVLKGELIINRGSIVNEAQFLKIKSFEREFGEVSFSVQQGWFSMLGQFILVGLILGILGCYLFFFRRHLFDDTNRMVVILLNLTLVVLVFSLAHHQNIPSVYLIPLCILPILTRALFDAGLAMMLMLVAVLLCSFFSSFAAEFMVLQLSAGMAAIFSLISIRKRSQFYLSSGIVFIVYALGYTAYTLVNKGDVGELIPLYYGYFAVNALLTLIASPMLFAYERLFGFVSDVSLMELSDSNSPLIRRLSYEAPGTFQHTLQVANLAEAAIYEVGGNALLVRTGALYHDIGKLTNPIYFIENQNEAVNPHDDLPFEESAQIIIGHVLDGIELAKKHKLPNILIDFIRTHHGDQRVEYFYQSSLRNFPQEVVDEQKFRYPGPKPFSKETAVLMMADSVEAASRSLKAPSAQSIAALVDGIIDKQVQNQQFINADITLRDMARIKKLFKKMLNSIYHVRIEYPDQKGG